ncbi:hypothetical protein BIY24_04580 [Halobacteriovorax marinus]|uniref:Exported protein n=1 Tax=Halobacteriovorax marinus (strain ATCC BAA-682 / DSM 15412 / SJ) TaxID=862908 RepID=E1WXQ1_HALMS|nr:hypothetical protein [Halobacteriovorax marinus]ATH07235.1 hypothetical protein BIY24_04580 [Halobacteriovorax marinus]CBW25857.1 putative exported protein [Halobacteriovorax marinus SJ]
MKLLLLPFLLLTVSAHANCELDAANYLRSFGNRSDRPMQMSAPILLEANTDFTTPRGQLLANYSIDTVVFYNTGSYHSGWFKEAVILNPENCYVLNHFVVEAE